MDAYMISGIKDAFKVVNESKDTISQVLYNRFNHDPYDGRVMISDLNTIFKAIKSIDNYLNDFLAIQDSAEFLHASIEANLPSTYLKDLRGYSKLINATINNWKNLLGV